MKSYKVGSVFGIDVKLHPTFLILLAFLALLDLATGAGWRVVVGGLFFTIAYFGIILLHELGHALMARQFGIRTFDIILLPIGGLARLERIPEQPLQELAVAIAGPMVNLVLAGIFALLAGVWLGGVWHPPFSWLGRGLFEQMVWVNLVLFGFNLLPAFPMDGGRVLRALLTIPLGRVRATRVAATVGKGMALLFALVGVIFQPMLIMIAFFVWTWAEKEARMVEDQAARRAATMVRIPLNGGDVMPDAMPRPPVTAAAVWVWDGQRWVAKTTGGP